VIRRRRYPRAVDLTRPPEPIDDGAHEEISDRTVRWAATMGGHPSEHDAVIQAHAGATARVAPGSAPLDREAREVTEDATLIAGATLARGAGDRAIEEDPDPLRTCFERDRDRILHSPAFRRLAGKTQVFIFPADHQRTRLTHALEVAQVASAIARACRLNQALTEAIALGHDCGHGPGGHASEDALSPFLPEGFDHAVWGADVTARPLNLCAETLDGIRNHSWSRPAPATPEGEVVGIADRLAYSAHDLEDAVHAGLVRLDQLPDVVVSRCGSTRSQQLQAFVNDVVVTTLGSGVVGMSAEMAEALGALRRFNYTEIYLRPASRAQGASVVTLLRALVEHYAAHPSDLPDGDDLPSGSGESLHRAVAYVAGMTDRYACSQAVALLDWPVEQLPTGLDVTGVR
jgi:dGTPase